MDDHKPASPGTRGAGQARYDRDLYGWAVEQAALLRAGRIAEADARNIAEEIDDVGNEQYDKLASALLLILVHLLKWDYQPERRSRSWSLSIQVQRNNVERVLRKNPGLKPHFEEAMADGYKNARLQAAGQTKLSVKKFPLRCPYSRRDITDRAISWPGDE
jgi:hypothetical protein